MAPKFEIACAHCGDRMEFPAVCHFGLSRDGTATLLASPERDAERWLQTSFSQLRREGRLRLGFPTVCLDCGHLGAYRADERASWHCVECGSAALYQLGADLRQAMIAGAIALALLLVVVPATSHPLLGVPGLLVVSVYLAGCRWLKRHGDKRLASAPCSCCGAAELTEQRVGAHSHPSPVEAPLLVPVRPVPQRPNRTR